MENEKNHMDLKYNEKFQIEVLLASNSIVEDVYNKINPFNISIRKFTFNIHSLINIIYMIAAIIFIYNSKFINYIIYDNFYKIEILKRIDYLYLFMPLIIMTFIEIIFNIFIKDRFKPNKDKSFFSNDLKSLISSSLLKIFLYLLSIKILDNHLHEFNKYRKEYLNKPLQSKYNYLTKQYINYSWNILYYIYIGSIIFNISLHLFFTNIYENQKNKKYLYIKNTLSEFYEKGNLINNQKTQSIYNELFK